jgi:hypothetical protein
MVPLLDCLCFAVFLAGLLRLRRRSDRERRVCRVTALKLRVMALSQRRSFSSPNGINPFIVDERIRAPREGANQGEITTVLVGSSPGLPTALVDCHDSGVHIRYRTCLA